MSAAPDLAIVGAGVIGLATAHAAAARGARVVVLERETPGSGQSRGPGRIFRHVHETPARVELAARAREGWRAAESELGLPLLGREGALLVGPAAEDAGRLAGAGVGHELLDGAGVLEAMPALGPWPVEGLLDPGGGVIDSEGYLAALAGRLGNRIERAEARAIRAEGDGVVVTTSAGARRAARVLVAAGAGTPELTRSMGLDLPLRALVHHRVALRPPRPADGQPCLLERSELTGPRSYGLPLADGGYALGVGAFDDLPEGEAVARTLAHAVRAMPGLAGEPAGVVRCVSTVLAGHPERFGLYAPDALGPRVAVFAGGNLFKLAPALGPLLAEALLERRDAVLSPP